MFVKIRKKKDCVSRACEPHLLKLACLQPVLHNKRSHHSERPGHGNWRVDPPARRPRAIQNKFKNMNVWLKTCINISMYICIRQRSPWSKLRFCRWSCTDARVGLQRRLIADELMLSNCGAEKDTWETFGLQGGWNRSPAQVGCMRQALGPGARGKPRGSGWRGRWEGGSGWRTHVNPWLFHFNVWQNPPQIKKKIR